MEGKQKEINKMAKNIPARYENEGTMNYLRRLAAVFPKASKTMLMSWIKGIPKIKRYSVRHQGIAEKARRVWQMASGMLNMKSA